MKNAYEYYYQELPMRKIIAVEDEIEKRLCAEELKLAAEYNPGAAYITLNMKNGSTLYVARNSKWNGKGYTKHVQLLNSELEVLASNEYKDDEEYPLMMIAVKILRLSKTRI